MRQVQQKFLRAAIRRIEKLVNPAVRYAVEDRIENQEWSQTWPIQEAAMHEIEEDTYRLEET